MQWAANMLSITHSSAWDINCYVPLSKVTREVVNLSAYLNLGFYDQLWCNHNTGLGPQLPGRWIGVAKKIVI